MILIFHCVGVLAVDLLSSSRADSKWDHSILRNSRLAAMFWLENTTEAFTTYVRKVAVVRECVKTRAGASDIVWPRSNPSVIASNINELVFVEGCERNVAWTTLSLLCNEMLSGAI